MDRSEEIPVPGLSVHFIRKIEEVTDRMTEGLEGLPFEEYTAKVNERRGELTEAYRAEYPGKKILVESFSVGTSISFSSWTSTPTSVSSVLRPVR